MAASNTYHKHGTASPPVPRASPSYPPFLPPLPTPPSYPPPPTHTQVRCILMLDGYSAPLTAGAFVDLVERGFYNGLPISFNSTRVLETYLHPTTTTPPNPPTHTRPPHPPTYPT